MEKTIFFHEICFFEKFRDDGVGVSSVSLRLTAPSAEGAKGDFVPAGTRRWTEAVCQLSDRPRCPFGLQLISSIDPKRWQVAAALSAAVTTTKPIGETPTSQAEPSKRKGAPRTPSALRERGSGGEALLSEKRPLPQSLSLSTFIVCLTEVWQDFIMKMLFVHIQSQKMNAALKKIKEVVPWTFRP